MAGSREEKLEQLLASFIQPMKNIPFEVIVRALFSVRVKKYDLRVRENKVQLKIIAQAMCNVCKIIQKQPIKKNKQYAVFNKVGFLSLKSLK